jgi:glycosyltransferase involved in cell wall biosynthesis
VTFVSDSTERLPAYQERLRPVAPLQLFGPLEALEHLQAEGGSYRYALLSRPEQASRYLPLVRGLAVHATAVYDTVDLHWVRLARAAEVTGDPVLLREAERFRTLELASASGADLVLAITAQEQATLRAELPAARVAVVPNIHAAVASVAPLAGRKDLFFIGGFEHQPNVDAVQWFVSEILPAVRRELPEVAFRVVGSRPTDEVKKLGSPGVQVAGFVADPEPFFARSRVFVSPLRYGAGMKGKIGQAMAFGLPVVTTSVGAEGMRLADGETALVADDPASFAAAVVRLYRDDQLWRRLSENGRSHIERHFSGQAVRGLLAELFPVVADPGATART